MNVALVSVESDRLIPERFIFEKSEPVRFAPRRFAPSSSNFAKLIPGNSQSLQAFKDLSFNKFSFKS